MKYKALKITLIAMIIASMAGCGDKKAESSASEATTEVLIEEASAEDTTIIETTTMEDTTVVTTQATTDAASQPTTQVAAPTPAPAPKSTPTPAPTQKSTPAPAAGSLGVTYKNQKIMLNTNINTVSSALGSTTDYSEAPSCNYDGLDKVFTYGDVSIYTYPHGSGDLINEIEVNDTSVATDKGIAPIGKSMADIKAVYGEPTGVEGSTYKYANGNCYTYFYADGDMVSYWGVVYEG